MNAQIDIRPSSIAGQWYPADPQDLAESVDSYITAAAETLPPISGEVIGLMVPHAGHRYSGPVAAHAFAAVRGLEPEIVAVISPMHYPYVSPLLTSSHDAYRTPLGMIPIDHARLQELDERLRSQSGPRLAQVSEDPEHSLEIELPFLQRVLKGSFQLLPLMVRELQPAALKAIGESLAAVLKDRRALLVASSDLSHFYPQEVAQRLDGAFLDQVEAFDPESVLRIEAEGKGFACGRGAVAIALWAAQALGADRARVLKYATSGEVTGDFTQVVGYAAAVITRPENYGKAGL